MKSIKYWTQQQISLLQDILDLNVKQKLNTELFGIHNKGETSRNKNPYI